MHRALPFFPLLFLSLPLLSLCNSAYAQSALRHVPTPHWSDDMAQMSAPARPSGLVTNKAVPQYPPVLERPVQPSDVSQDYYYVAKALARAGSTSSWAHNLRSLDGNRFVFDKRGGPVIPFYDVGIILIDCFHEIVTVDARYVFAPNMPGHVIFCDLARVARAVYSMLVEMYKMGTEDDFTAL